MKALSYKNQISGKATVQIYMQGAQVYLICRSLKKARKFVLCAGGRAASARYSTSVCFYYIFFNAVMSHTFL
jgi:hypothetical protein